MAKKKKKKNVAKRQAKAGKRKVQKRKLRLVKAKKQQPIHHQDDDCYSPPRFGTPPFDGDVDVPSGFRAIGMSEALMEFAKDMIKNPDIKGLNSMEDAFQLAMPLWNYTPQGGTEKSAFQLAMPLWNYTPQRGTEKSALAQEQDEADDTLRSEIIKALMPVCKVGREEAGKLVDQVIVRKNEMFPPDIQPQGSPYMFMRKEVLHLITPFNYDRLIVSDEVIPVSGLDQRLFDQLAALDEVKKDADDYEDWQKQYEVVRENFGEVFFTWLTAKGVGEDMANDFIFKAEFFINFIYNYGCTDILCNTDYGCFDEFFYDFVLRKIMLEPGEHVEWAPALRLFFIFLAEKGYVDDAMSYVEAINNFEEPFLSLLRKEYG